MWLGRCVCFLPAGSLNLIVAGLTVVGLVYYCETCPTKLELSCAHINILSDISSEKINNLSGQAEKVRFVQRCTLILAVSCFIC